MAKAMSARAVFGIVCLLSGCLSAFLFSSLGFIGTDFLSLVIVGMPMVSAAAAVVVSTNYRGVIPGFVFQLLAAALVLTYLSFAEESAAAIGATTLTLLVFVLLHIFLILGIVIGRRRLHDRSSSEDPGE